MEDYILEHFDEALEKNWILDKSILPAYCQEPYRGCLWCRGSGQVDRS